MNFFSSVTVIIFFLASFPEVSFRGYTAVFLLFLMYAVHIGKEQNLRLIVFLLNFTKIFSEKIKDKWKRIKNERININFFGGKEKRYVLKSAVNALKTVIILLILIAIAYLMKISVKKSLFVVPAILILIWFFSEEDKVLKEMTGFMFTFTLSRISVIYFNLDSWEKFNLTKIILLIATYSFAIRRLLDFKKIRKIVEENKVYRISEIEEAGKKE